MSYSAFDPKDQEWELTRGEKFAYDRRLRRLLVMALFSIFSACGLVVVVFLWLEDRKDMLAMKEETRTLRQLDAVADRMEERLVRPVPPAAVRGWVTVPGRNNQTIPAAGARARAYPASAFPLDAVGLSRQAPDFLNPPAEPASKLADGTMAAPATSAPSAEALPTPVVTLPRPPIELENDIAQQDPLTKLLDRLPAPAGETVTDAEGIFELAGLPPGRHVVVVTYERGKGAEAKKYFWFIEAVSSDSPSLSVFCTPGQASTPLDPGIKWLRQVSSDRAGSPVRGWGSAE